MIKYVLTALVFVLSTVSSMRAGASSDQPGELRKQLQSANTPAFFSKGTKAYVALMHLGKDGFEVLANSWAYDQIPEENWLQWNDDFMVRHGKGANNDTDNAYALYLDQKLQKDDKFAAAAAKRLVGIKIYDKQALLTWMKAGPGSRRIGYMALKQRHPEVPPFDYNANDIERAKQLQEIETLLNTKEKYP